MPRDIVGKNEVVRLEDVRGNHTKRVKLTRAAIIDILDVEGLREGACECYETVKEQYGQLLGTP